jgi:hypothetical protein
MKLEHGILVGGLAGTLTYEVTAGSHISRVVDEMIDLSKEYNIDVVSTFNGIALSVNPDSSACKVLKDWDTEMNRRAEEYAKSKEGKQAKQERENKRIEHQKKVDELQAELYNVVNTDKILDWCSQLAEHGDYVGVWFDKPRIIEKLERAGYTENAYVGYKGEFGKYISLMYIVGQVINCLRKGMPPHQVTISFVREWKEKYTN